MSKHSVIFIRHAQAESSSTGGDEKRALTPEGKEQAQTLGRKLAAHLGDVGKVFLSPATRAVETWNEIVAGSQLDAGNFPEPQIDPVIYAGDAQGIINLPRFGGENETVVIVGHEPTISEAISLIVKDDVEVPASLATSSAVLVGASHDWKEWHSHVATSAEVVA